MSTTSTAIVAKKSKSLPALIPMGSDGTKLAAVQTKTSKGTRVLRPWEFRAEKGLSRKEAAEQYPVYFAKVAREMNTQVAAAIANGQFHTSSFSMGAGGNITLKAKTALPVAEVIKETKKEVKAMGDKEAAAHFGLPANVLNALKALTPEQLAAIVGAAAPAAAPVAAPAAPAADGKTLDQVLAEAKAEGATA